MSEDAGTRRVTGVRVAGGAGANAAGFTDLALALQEPVLLT